MSWTEGCGTALRNGNGDGDENGNGLPMRVFIYEYACALRGGLALPESIRSEGRAMLSAVVEDFARLPDVHVLTLLDESADREEELFRTRAAAAEWSLIISPEFDDLLLTRCRWVEEAGGRLLGPSPEAVRLAGDKWAAYQLLRNAGVPTPVTWLATDPAGRAEHKKPRVVKPRFGAGSQGVRLVPPSPLPRGSEGRVRGDESMLIQEYVQGVAASVAFLTGPDTLTPLLPAYQHLSADGSFRYLGGRIPLPPGQAGRAVRLGRRALEALGVGRGYVGVDLVLDEKSDGSGDVVVEINPRLTTSYVGLRALAKDNLAGAMLVAASGAVPEIRWQDEGVLFEPGGRVRFQLAAPFPG